MEERFVVFSDGRSGKDFADALEKENDRLSRFILELLREHEIVGTDKIAYKLVVFVPRISIISNGGVEFVARGDRKWLTPPRFIAPLLAEKLSDERIREMGVETLIVMHDPFADAQGSCWHLGINTYGAYRVDIFAAGADVNWRTRVGFVYLEAINSTYSSD